ncbi:pyrimidine/purine nucleoside phosphorylase [Paenibacillus sp. N1-5-1-14]|uniref:pyrimidine/purine nucleoside phosphorylase n=1 Tax=Paenibacillus radicibacter TaxID=2972488 RepID=UPI0021593705|nr:pyrimidine/purine nucleoside phosphorylase [Paenibacillus radicibacter]MCR8645606.1 pyrimidine/purine nucleoside phosphorylase [Paenibacillus radicibacter]
MSDKFEQVSVLKKANVYFEGKVTSRAVILADETKVTLGIMLPGDYEFGTDSKEIMEILSGELKVLLPDSEEWQAITGPAEFTVPANAKFKLQVATVTDYCCRYVD